MLEQYQVEPGRTQEQCPALCSGHRELRVAQLRAPTLGGDGMGRPSKGLSTARYEATVYAISAPPKREIWRPWTCCITRVWIFSLRWVHSDDPCRLQCCSVLVPQLPQWVLTDW